MSEAKLINFRIDPQCGEPGCTRVPTTIAIGVVWRTEQLDIYALCDEHASAAMGRARFAKADEEGLH
jgi:hypothetical protein